MTALGPKAEAAIAEFPIDMGIMELLIPHIRRVALIAHAEGFAAGARAQREMEPTAEMCFAGGAAVAENGGEGTQHEQRGDALAAYRAMQRVAPLAGEEK